jgi:hypothetical protein
LKDLLCDCTTSRTSWFPNMSFGASEYGALGREDLLIPTKEYAH